MTYIVVKYDEEKNIPLILHSDKKYYPCYMEDYGHSFHASIFRKKSSAERKIDEIHKNYPNSKIEVKKSRY